LASEEALDAIDCQQYILDQVSDFVLKHVIVYDDVFLFFKKKFLRHFNVKTSRAHEGTNFGIKEHAAAVLPSHRINVAGEKVCLQLTMKGTQLESESTYMASSQSLWSQSPSANHVTTLAESIISHANGRTHAYAVHRTADKSWEVHFVGHDNYCLETDRLPMNRNSPIPIFTRIRAVTNLDQFLCCDCGGHEQIGLTCVHTMAVMGNCFPEWAGPTHHGVSPCWWVTWLELAHKPNNHQISTSSIMTLMTNEVPGPRIHAPIPASASYCPVTANRTALNCVKNCLHEQLHALVPSNQVVQRGNAMRTTIIKGGMTQESYILGNNSSDKEEDSEEKDNDIPSNQEDSLFASSLLLDGLSSNVMSSARDILKPQLNEVLQCLDALKSEASIQMPTKVLNDLANQLPLNLGGTSAPKRNMDNCPTVNINVEDNLLKKSRSYASKNC
jgi:hypothetical protein